MTCAIHIGIRGPCRHCSETHAAIAAEWTVDDSIEARIRAGAKRGGVNSGKTRRVIGAPKRSDGSSWATLYARRQA